MQELPGEPSIDHLMPDGFKALVIGASGAIGAEFALQLKALGRCARVLELHRGSTPALDFEQPDSIAEAARLVAPHGPFNLVVNAVGMLHDSGFGPEKKLADLDMQQMQTIFTANVFGPALVLKHFVPLLARDRAVVAMLSAKVGSIGDNRLGGWYSYRSSKAALNMLVKTAAIEIKRSNPNAIAVALHPGTVDSRLSAPFRGALIGRPAAIAVGDMLRVLASLKAADSGSFIGYDGTRLPW